MTTLRRCLVLGLIALSVAGCGRKGGLEPPGTAAETGAAAPATTVFGTLAPSRPPREPAKTDTPFILDGLI